MPYGLKPLEDIIELAIVSAWIKPKPVSIGIFAPPDYGKTETLLQYRKCKGVEIMSDTTSYGLNKFLVPEITAKRVRYLIFPDFSKILNRSWRVANEVLSLLNLIIEEGVSSVYTYNIQFNSDMLDLDRIRVGCILATPEDILKRKEGFLKRYGFWSRILPFYIKYTKEDMLRVHEEIKEEKTSFRLKNIKVPDEDIEIKLPKEEADKLDSVVMAYKESVGSETGFRLRRNLQQLAKSNAWLHGRDTVTEEDIRKVISFAPFLFNPLKGDECTYRILQILPARSEEIVKELSGLYSRATIYRRLSKLKESRVIVETDKGWDLNMGLH